MPIALSAPERQKLKVVIKNIVDSLTRIDGEREAIKDMIAGASEEYDIEKKMIRKLATTIHNSNFPEIQSENDDFEYLYESIVEGKNVSTETNSNVRNLNDVR